MLGQRITLSEAADMVEQTALVNLGGTIGQPYGAPLTHDRAQALLVKADEIVLGRHNGQDALHLNRTGYGWTTLYVRLNTHTAAPAPASTPDTDEPATAPQPAGTPAPRPTGQPVSRLRRALSVITRAAVTVLRRVAATVLGGRIARSAAAARHV